MALMSGCCAMAMPPPTGSPWPASEENAFGHSVACTADNSRITISEVARMRRMRYLDNPLPARRRCPHRPPKKRSQRKVTTEYAYRRLEHPANIGPGWLTVGRAVSIGLLPEPSRTWANSLNWLTGHIRSPDSRASVCLFSRVNQTVPYIRYFCVAIFSRNTARSVPLFPAVDGENRFGKLYSLHAISVKSFVK